jgi:hypothetical protein
VDETHSRNALDRSIDSDESTVMLVDEPEKVEGNTFGAACDDRFVQAARHSAS